MYEMWHNARVRWKLCIYVEENHSRIIRKMFFRNLNTSKHKSDFVHTCVQNYTCELTLFPPTVHQKSLLQTCGEHHTSMYHLDKTEHETDYCFIFVCCVCCVLQLWTGRGDQDLMALEGKRGPKSNKARPHTSSLTRRAQIDR